VLTFGLLCEDLVTFS